MRREKGEGVERATGCRWTMRVGALALAVGLAGCGGGGGEAVLPPGDGASSQTGTLRVKVTDVFGDPVTGASVEWWVQGREASSALTGADGIAQLANVRAGTAKVCARHWVRGDSCGGAADVTLNAGQVLELSRQLELREGSAATVLQASVPAGGKAADGRTLDVTVRVAVTDAAENQSWLRYLQVSNCEARIGTELADLGPRCIAGPGEGDASYAFEGFLDTGVAMTAEVEPPSTAVGLLIDQSYGGFAPDRAPTDPRLFPAKLFVDSLMPGNSLLFAAFANDTATGSASTLPRRPVTFFPVAAPGFIDNRSEAFGVLADLYGLIGGGAPLYEAIATGIEFLADQSPPGSWPALVVVADGEDDSDCGADQDCAALRQHIIRRAHETGVRLFLVAADSDAGCSQVPDLGGRSRDCAWYIDSKAPIRQLSLEGEFPLGVGFVDRLYLPLELARQWLSGAVSVQDIRLRLTSDVPGAFAPGAVVTGALSGVNAKQAEYCGDGLSSPPCDYFHLPFRVQVPQGAP